MFRRIAASALLALTIAACGVVDNPIEVTSLSPEDGATGVAVDVQLEATFDTAIDETTLDGNFSLSSPSGDVAGTIGYVVAARTATFTPDADLEYDTTYTATVSGSVATTGGDSLAGDASWSFTTATEPAPDDAIGGLEVDPATATLNVGATEQLTATATGVVGTPDESVTWSSDDVTVATVDATGLVTAEGAGTATITATSDFDATITATAAITVELQDAIGGLDVSPATATLAIAATEQLTATATGVVGTPDESVTWSSDDETVATVDATGLVTAEGAGTATITATSDFDATVTDTATITVAAPLSGADYLFDAIAGTPIDPVLEADLTGGAAPFTFEISTTPETPLLVNGLPPGVTLDAATGEISGTPDTANYYRAAIDVTDAAGQTIEILAEIDVELAFSYGSAEYFYDPTTTGVVVPDTEIELIGSTGPEIYSMVLASNDGPGVAADWSIDPDTGAISRVTGSTPDTTTWTYTVTVVDDGGSKSATFDVTLTEFAIGGLDVSPATATLAIAATEQLTATATGVVGTPDESVTWSSDDVTVATVDATGLVTAEGAGTATITATSDFDGSVSGTASITVDGGPI